LDAKLKDYKDFMSLSVSLEITDEGRQYCSPIAPEETVF
jgi:hypothetical protein